VFGIEEIFLSILKIIQAKFGHDFKCCKICQVAVIARSAKHDVAISLSLLGFCSINFLREIATALADAVRMNETLFYYPKDTKSNAISAVGAECVKAPTEIISTPVWAIAWTVVKLTPPDASRIMPLVLRSSY
jgi:hypothetical protein